LVDLHFFYQSVFVHYLGNTCISIVSTSIYHLQYFHLSFIYLVTWFLHSFYGHIIYILQLTKKLIFAVSVLFSGCCNKVKFSYTYRSCVAVIIMCNFNTVSLFFHLLIIIYITDIYVQCTTSPVVKFFYLFNNFVFSNCIWSTFFLTEQILELQSLFELEFIYIPW
jgi:hypothetical protein